MGIGEIIQKFLGDSGIVQFFANANYGWQNAVMLIVAFVLLYLAIFRSFEPYLLIPIAFGMLLVVRICRPFCTLNPALCTFPNDLLFL